MDSNLNFSDRQLEVLVKIVELYIRNGEPVGSRVLSKLADVGISPASLRNVMTDLSEMSMVWQPHTSAGRVPTDLGYRVYVDRLMDCESLSCNARSIEETFEGTDDNLDDLLKAAAELLAKRSNAMGVATQPKPVKSRMKVIEFIQLDPDQILIVLVTKTGLVRNRLVRIREQMDRNFLSGLSQYLNEKFSDRPLSEVRNELLDALSDNMHSEPQNFARALRLGKKAFDLNSGGQLHVCGQNNFFKWSDFSDRRGVTNLFLALENHADILNLFDRVPESEDVYTFIGEEHCMENLESCSVVCANYGVKGNNLGYLAVLGPKRLDYSEIIPFVAKVADVLNERLLEIAE